MPSAVAAVHGLWPYLVIHHSVRVSIDLLQHSSPSITRVTASRSRDSSRALCEFAPFLAYHSSSSLSTADHCENINDFLSLRRRRNVIDNWIIRVLSLFQRSSRHGIQPEFRRSWMLLSLVLVVPDCCCCCCHWFLLSLTVFVVVVVLGSCCWPLLLLSFLLVVVVSDCCCYCRCGCRRRPSLPLLLSPTVVVVVPGFCWYCP